MPKSLARVAGFQELKNPEHQRKVEASRKVAAAKSSIATLKGLDAEVKKAEQSLNKVYAAFENDAASFTQDKLKKVATRLANLSTHLKVKAKVAEKQVASLVFHEMPADRALQSHQDLSLLAHKATALRCQAIASLASSEDDLETLIPVDEQGYEVDPAQDEDADQNGVGDEAVEGVEDDGISAAILAELENVNPDPAGEASPPTTPEDLEHNHLEATGSAEGEEDEGDGFDPEAVYALLEDDVPVGNLEENRPTAKKASTTKTRQSNVKQKAAAQQGASKTASQNDELKALVSQLVLV